MLDREHHEILLKKILADIYQDKNLGASIAFKGGTCLYLFYNLDRFSTDLDFNVIADKLDKRAMTLILNRHLNIDQAISKRNTWFWIGSFEKGKQKIKVEISKRNYPDKYINQNFYGLTVPILSKDCMFAHKLCALTDRKKLQNRDVYDAFFMFQNGFEVNEEIIEIRTNKSSKEYFKDLVTFLKKNVKPNLILDGLGEVLNEKQKSWVKSNLFEKLLFELEIRTG